ncbi:MAG: alpha/beta hydrolase [Clostridia bacterium]|nr:alpha/beta hydrolase [Clostridia bacterium]
MIIILLVLLCMISLRKTGKDIRELEFVPGSRMEKLKASIVEGQAFFKDHRGDLLVLDANGVTLAARRFPQQNPKGRMILFHGYRSIAENDFGAVMSFYYSMGYELILVDQRAHGKSSGLWIGFGILERYDCKAWVQYLNSEYGAIPTFLSGISMGCSTVLMATGLELPKNVCGILADCGFTSPKEIIAHVMRRKLHLPLEFLMPALSLFSKIFAGYYFGEYSALDAMKTNRLPILFIHGKEDHYVPVEMTVRNYEACISEKKLILVDGAGHGTSYLQDKETVEEAIRLFLKKHTPSPN